jgi:hypothetical protein
MWQGKCQFDVKLPANKRQLVHGEILVFFPHGIPALLHIQILLVKDEFSPLEQFSLLSKPEYNMQCNWP